MRTPKTAAEAAPGGFEDSGGRTGEERPARASAPRAGRAVLRTALIPVLAVMLATLCTVSAGIGAVAVPFDEVVGALVGLLTFLADDAQLRSISFWSLGSIGGATWPVVAGVLPFTLAGLALIPFSARALDVLALGERGARHLGVDTERVRLGVITLAALLTGAAVAAAGVIGFVGLVVPHLIRLVAGPGHRMLLPASALTGAFVLLAADLVARTVAVPAELPIGVLTALLGGPFFLWLLRRTRSRQGGWA